MDEHAPLGSFRVELTSILSSLLVIVPTAGTVTLFWFLGDHTSGRFWAYGVVVASCLGWLLYNFAREVTFQVTLSDSSIRARGVDIPWKSVTGVRQGVFIPFLITGGVVIQGTSGKIRIPRTVQSYGAIKSYIESRTTPST